MRAVIKAGGVLAVWAAAELALGVVALAAGATRAERPPIELKSEKITLPYGDRSFGTGAAARAANGRCLLCHSIGMIDTQPPLEMAVWKAEVEKMRSAFGCPLPAGEVDELVRFLYARNHAPAQPGRSAATGSAIGGRQPR